VKRTRKTNLLRIGINALYLIPGGVGGTEIYLRSLLAALAVVDKENQYFVYMNRETGDDLVPFSANFHPVRCWVRAGIRPFRIIFEQSGLPCLLAGNRIDVVLNPGYTASLAGSWASVTVFHDLQYKRHPEFFRFFDLPFWKLLLPLAVRRSCRIIAVSESTACDLVHFFPGAADKIRVIPHGVDRMFFRIGESRRLNGPSPKPYLLAVSTLHPHKNLERLLDAFLRFRNAHPEYRLIVAGLEGFAAKHIRSRIGALGLNDSVVLTGWVPRADLYGLFENASAFIAPSLFEGFGLPLVEALAAGIPTACSAIPTFDWVAGEAALRFDPLSVPEMADAMELVAMDSAVRAHAAFAGPERARGFDWARTAASTLQELCSAARH
jgi:glycosyltransferase involved in cell wall biosynthesis